MKPRYVRYLVEAKLAARIERHVSAGSIKRAAAALSSEPLADTSDPTVLAKLRALHTTEVGLAVFYSCYVTVVTSCRT